MKKHLIYTAIIAVAATALPSCDLLSWSMSGGFDGSAPSVGLYLDGNGFYGPPAPPPRPVVPPGPVYPDFNPGPALPPRPGRPQFPHGQPGPVFFEQPAGYGTHAIPL